MKPLSNALFIGVLMIVLNFSCQPGSGQQSLEDINLDSKDIVAYERIKGADGESFRELRISGSGELIYSSRGFGESTAPVRTSISEQETRKLFQKLIQAGITSEQSNQVTSPPLSRISAKIDGKSYEMTFRGKAPSKYSTIFKSLIREHAK